MILQFINTKHVIFGLTLWGSIAITQPAFSYQQGSSDTGIFDKLLNNRLYLKSITAEMIDETSLTEESLLNPQALKQFYENNQGALQWNQTQIDVPVQDKLQSLHALLEQSWTHGLNPENYHTSRLKQLINEPNPSIKDKIELELLMSDGIAQYGSDMSGKREASGPHIGDDNILRQAQTPLSILTSLSYTKDPAGLLKQLEPRGDFYTALRTELVKLSSNQNNYDYLLPLKFNRNLFEPGMQSNDVVGLRKIMGTSLPPGTAERKYDTNLEAAVKAYQEHHNLLADGVIGPKTLSMLNRSNKDKMEQIIANMERVRGMDRDLSDRYILVNIPSQMLWAVDGGKVQHMMPVVVGLPHRQTRIFKTEVTGVRLNPTWTVPLKLKMEDMLPKLRQDATAMEQKDIHLWSGYGRNAEKLDPQSINWNTMSWREMNTIRMVQSPGEHNALGRFRVLMQNKHDIYLHDTNHKELFAREDRTLSSGCIRLSQPDVIADFVLSSKRDWSKAKTTNILEEGKMTDISIDRPFPVYIVYQTIWQNEEGELVYGPDVYKKDQKLLRSMAQHQAYKLPERQLNELADISEDQIPTAIR